MTAKIDTMVQAAVPVTLPLPKSAQATLVPATAARELEREKRRVEHEARVARWKSIGESGGIDAWVRAELKKQGTLVETDPSRLADKDKGKYKEQKKAEAEARGKLKKQAWQAWQATHITHLGSGVHWHDKTEADRFDIENREERLKANGLPELKTPDDLAKALGLSIPRLRWMAFHRDVDTGTHYRRWQIPKKDGSFRTITAPKKELKAAQRWMLRTITEKLPVHGAAHGFLPSRSIVTNARAHVGAHTVVNVDVKDFFPTITWKRVRGLYRKAGLPEQVATLLALLATESPREVVQFRGKTHYVAAGERALPQGAPTSPAITNAICMRLDRRMSGLARRFGFRYTRYADDLTFSWRVPADAAEGTHPKAPVGMLLRGIGQILRAEGFQLHPTKTKVLRPGNRQTVTGLVINDAPDGASDVRVPREVRRRLKAAIYNREKGRGGKEGETLAQLKGMAAYVYMTDAKLGRHYLDRIAKLEGE
jgi:hypothetical protein